MREGAIQARQRRVAADSIARTVHARLVYRAVAIIASAPRRSTDGYLNRRLGARTAWLLLAGAVAAGCGGSGGGARARPLIGVALLTETHAFYKELEDALRKEAASRGISTSPSSPARWTRPVRHRRSRTSSPNVWTRSWRPLVIRVRSFRISTRRLARAFPSSRRTSRPEGARSCRTSPATTSAAGGLLPRRLRCSSGARAT